MRIDWWTLALQAVNALLLVWLLAHFLFRPVAKIVEQRQRASAALIEEAAAQKTAAEAERQQAASEAARIEADRARLLEAAAADADKLKASLELNAREDIEHMRDAARERIDCARHAAALADNERASEFALEIAARLLDRLDPGARIAGFVEGLARELAGLPETIRRQIAAGSTPLRLIAPRELSDDELGACSAALASVLGHAPRIEVDVDSGLIAGLELETAHAIVRNSFRHDLGRLRGELLSREAHRE
jgi:F-type H+-transporting ATPase subunit b